MYAKLKTAALVIFIIGAGAFAIAAVSGFLYEQAQRAKDRERLPQVGRSVDIGGRSLNIFCSGSGQPAVILERGSPWTLYDPKVIFENGAPRPGYGWVSIQRELAKTTTACWYDRAGTGWSDLGPYPRDSSSQAHDLHALLQAAGVPPPYLLVAETSAALDARVYTGLYPADVAGLVLVNGVHPDYFVKIRPGGGRFERMPKFVGHSQDAMAQAFNLFGFYRLGLPNRPAPAPPPKGLTSAEWSTIWRLTRSSKARSALMQDIGACALSTAQARAAGSLGDRPMIVLTAEDTSLPYEHRSTWLDLQTDQSRLSSRGQQLVVDPTNGELIYEAPAAVVSATRQVIDDLRVQTGGRQ